MLAAAAIGGVALVAIIAVGASGMLSGGATPSSSPVANASSSAAPSAAPSATPALTPSPSPEPTATPAPTPTPVPTPTPTPSGRAARITGITLSGGSYVVDYQVLGYTAVLPGRHVQLFFNTVSEDQAGVPGKRSVGAVRGSVPFTKYGVGERPGAATQMCILVANADHSIVKGSGNCVDLPS
jgi:hypothetical protein